MGHMDKKFLVLHNPLRNIEITKYFNNKPKFNGVFSKYNLSNIKDGAYVISLSELNIFLKMHYARQIHST